MDLTGVVVCVAGPLSSGKTTTAAALRRRNNAELVSFGDYVRAVAADRGRPASRTVWQQLGDELIDDLGWRELCRRVLEQADLTEPGRMLVVDGVRHVQALEHLEVLLHPRPVLLVFLNPSPRQRSAMLEADNISSSQAHGFDSHDTEQQVRDGALAAAAGLTVTEPPGDAAAARIDAWLAARSDR